jgi:hypothetical protein
MPKKQQPAQENTTNLKINENVVKEEKMTKKSFEEVDSLPQTSTKTSWVWIKDTNGRPSMSATFATVAFFVTTLSFVLSMFESIGSLKFRAFDVGACGAYLVPILTLYFSRRWTADKIDFDKLKTLSDKSNKKGSVEDEQ